MAIERVEHVRARGEAGARGARGAHASLAAAAQAMHTNRGRARQARCVFDKSIIPMVMLDNTRRYVEANRAARLLFRMSLAELRMLRIDDLTPRALLPALEDEWRQMLDDGYIGGRRITRCLDGSQLSVVFCRLPNLLPGQHLSVFAPADWPADELGTPDDASAESVPGPLSPRQREVLALVATGAELAQIGEELTISPATVRTHVANALLRLGARNRAHTVALALQQGLIDPPLCRCDEVGSG